MSETAKKPIAIVGGGFIIADKFVITYLDLPGMLRMAIYLELIFGSAQNLINVVSNIVAMVEEEGVRDPQD